MNSETVIVIVERERIPAERLNKIALRLADKFGSKANPEIAELDYIREQAGRSGVEGAQ